MRGIEHNMSKVSSFGGFSLFYRLWALAHIPSQKQKSIRNSCTFGAKQFKTSRFSLKQGIKSKPYCRMARFLTQFQRKDTVLNHIGFDSPHLKEEYMSSILKDFYNGDLCPADRRLAHGEEAESYLRLLDMQETAAKRLESSLDEQELKNFRAYCELQMQINTIEQEDMFLYAFRLGAHLEQELLLPRKGSISAENF